jgi:hypothetical protein
MPNITMMPEPIAIRLITTCSIVKVDKLSPNVMTDTPLQIPNECYDAFDRLSTFDCAHCRQLWHAAPIKIKACMAFNVFVLPS